MKALGRLLKDNVALIVVIAVIVGAFFFLRTPSSNVTTEELSAAIGSGQPVLIELFSNT
jgi:hypothetical protein